MTDSNSRPVKRLARVVVWIAVLAIALPVLLYLVAVAEYLFTNTSYAENILDRLGLLNWIAALTT